MRRRSFFLRGAGKVLVLIFLCLMVSSIHAAGTPHTVSGSVSLEEGGSPSSVTFSATNTTTGETLYQSSAGCGYGSGYYWIQCSTFPSGWTAGDRVNVSLTGDGRSTSGSVTLTNNSNDVLNLVLPAPEETISQPGTPSGETNPVQNQSYSYSTSGATSNLGHTIQYQFNWGDGSTSSWSTSTSASHSWSITGSKTITVTARCQTHTNKSNTSSGLSVNVQEQDEVISQPGTPSGQTSPVQNQSYTYSTSGATSNLGHTIQYQFSWGDGSTSSWSTSTSASHSWSTTGSKTVTVTARCQTHTNKTNTSSGLNVNVQEPEEVISEPGTPTGETNPVQNQTYTYSTSGASSSMGHTLEYNFYWGDGSTSSWSTSKSASHSWSAIGSKTVWVEARCQSHPDKSNNSSGLSVNVQEPDEVISQPGTPSGQTSPVQNQSYTYSTSGASSNLGHTIQYQFNWGDGTTSSWSTSTSASNSWSTTGSKTVTVTARCQIHTNKTNTSSGLNVNVQEPDEVISQPGIPSGENNPTQNQSYTYSTSGATSNLGHNIQYRFNWGDGSTSSWSTSKTASHSWSTTGSKTVTVSARCQIHTDKSNTSSGLSINVLAPEVISQPGTPSGETSPVQNQSYTYSTSGATSNLGHTVQYQFNWGDGTTSSWSTSKSASHSWSTTGYKTVTVTARCQVHTSKSNTSSGLSVNVQEPEEVISQPGRPTGETTPLKDQGYNYATSGATSNLGHTVEYRFYWGDGTYSSWSTSKSASHSWSAAGSRTVSVSARCQAHHDKINTSSGLGVNVVNEEMITRPGTPSGTTDVIQGQSYSYSTTGASSNVGHTIQYQFNWGDGTTSSWSTSKSASHIWQTTGSKTVTVKARCQTHTDKTNTSYGLTVNVDEPEEEISQPGKPSGQTSPVKGLNYTYMTTGASSNLGHALEYRFDWGDGTTSSWSTSKTASHSWSASGSMTVRVTARCQMHTNKSRTSTGLVVNVQEIEEIISKPGIAAGEINPVKGQTYTYNTSGAESNLGHTLEYSFNWGDGTSSPWDTSKTATYSWSTSGLMVIVVSTRCTIHPECINTSDELSVQVQEPEEMITKPGMPEGEASPVQGILYIYKSSGSVSNLDHNLEYQYSWGDGTTSDWSSSTSETHVWENLGDYKVTVTARCQEHTEKFSISDTLTVVVIKNDKKKPFLESCYPPGGSIGIPKNTIIQFRVDDNGYGVDQSSINVSVNEMMIMVNGMDQTSGRVSKPLSSQSYTIYYDPEEPFHDGSNISIHVQCADLASPPNSLDTVYTFTVGISMLERTGATEIDENGGTVHDDVTGIQIDIPAGAVQEPVEITISVVDNLPPLPNELDVVGLKYHFGPDGIQFNDSVSVRIPYSNEDIIDANVSDPMDLSLYYFSMKKGEWIPLTIYDADEDFIYFKVLEFCFFTFCEAEVNSIDEILDLYQPDTYALMQNYPNPFNPETWIEYHLPEECQVRLEIYNVMGQRIKTLVDQLESKGRYQVVWNGKDMNGNLVCSGTYVYILRTGERVQMMKATYMK